MVVRLEQSISIIIIRLTCIKEIRDFLSNIKLSGNYSVGATPDPIPNSEVKSYSADGTARETSVGE